MLVEACGALRAEPGTRVIETPEELRQTFEEAYPDEEFRPEPPVVDFEQNVVVEARWGEDHVDNHYLVTRVREFDAYVELTLTFRTTCSDGDDEHYTCSLAEVPRRDKPFTFVERLEIGSPVTEDGVCPTIGDPSVIGSD